MIARAFKLRFRRRLRLQKLQVEEFGQQAEQKLERNLFRRLERLVKVRRFVASWFLLMVLLGGCVVVQTRQLSGLYQNYGPAPGGVYTEGILGSYTNANPLYATGPVDTSVSKLLFSGLLTYNDDNQLVGDLARQWTVDARGTLYTVYLRPNLRWHDGTPLTSQDVLFTYQTIQNPDAQSPLNASWQGVKVAAPDKLTVTFTLPGALASFPYSLTNGIVPKHVLANVPVGSLRSVAFNTTTPVGSGPFAMRAVEVTGNTPEEREERVALKRFENYHRGKPQLEGFVVHSFKSKDRIISSFDKQEINGMVGLTQVPDQVRKSSKARIYSIPMTAEVMAFFRTTQGVLNDPYVRTALVRATDRDAIIKSLGYPARPVNEPFLIGQLGYDAKYAQPPLDLKGANEVLDKTGWWRGADGWRHKEKTTLAFQMDVQEDSEYASVANLLKDQWRMIGVQVTVNQKPPLDFRTSLSAHGYEALLYGISVGKDPDVFAYWDSKQADVAAPIRLNFSEWQSKAADIALEAGRTRTDPAIRVVKYQPFLQAWQAEAPAVGLYQPRFLYITHGRIGGLSDHYVNSEAQRFANVHRWTIRQTGVSQKAVKP